MPDALQLLGTATLSISAALPATYDSTGFAALTYTPVGEVVDVPEFGKSAQLVMHNPIGGTSVQKLKGSFNQGSTTIVMARDDDDAGQVICLAGLAAATAYSIKITYADATVDYFTALVMSYNSQGGTRDSIVNRVMQLEINSDVVTA